MLKTLNLEKVIQKKLLQCLCVLFSLTINKSGKPINMHFLSVFMYPNNEVQSL